ncbi:MAG: hypothetical protein Q7S40_24985 [Opitutaceae bacterium]|nr:hypothetical protein [Opitutaceae bacterium]
MPFSRPNFSGMVLGVCTNIDRHVYALYGLTPAEIKIVGESVAPKPTVT